MYIISPVPAVFPEGILNGSINKHQQKTEATKRKLLKAARRIFVRDGFEATRIEDIAAEAGHTRGAFYAHFQTKEDLFFALLEEQTQMHLERLRKPLEEWASEKERMCAVRDFYVSRSTDRQWAVLILEFKLYALRHSKIRAKLADTHRSIKKKIKLEGIRELLPDELRSDLDCAEWRKVTLQAMLQALVLEHAYDPASISQEQVQAILARMFDLVVTTREL